MLYLLLILGECDMQTPFEIIVWNKVLIIRKKFAKNLIENYDFTQRVISNKLAYLTE